MQKKIKVIIADDHPVLRKGIRFVFESRDEYSIVAEAEDGIQALEAVAHFKPDIVVMDISMPHDGIRTARRITSEHAVKVIVFTMYLNKNLAIDAFNAGASGYVLKGADIEELFAAVAKVLSGGKYISPALAEELLNCCLAPEESEARQEALTDREVQVMRLICDGASAKEAAASLSISCSAIKKHKSNLKKKLNLRNNTDIVKWALESGLLKNTD